MIGPGEQGGSRGPVATLTVRPGSGGPSIEQIESALRELYPPEEFKLQRRAMSIDGETEVVFDVYGA